MKKVRLILGLAVVFSILFTSCDDNNTEDLLETAVEAESDTTTAIETATETVSETGTTTVDVGTSTEVETATTTEVEVLEIASGIFENLWAPQEADYSTGAPVVSGDFTKFSFAEGATVTSDDWDIAFRGTTIIVNGGEAYGFTDEPARTGDAGLVLETGTFASITTASNDANYRQDAEGVLALKSGSGNGWYTYDGSTHLISPIAGKVLVIKTINGNYAKIEILSYYKDYDTSSDNRYYSFNYAYNPNVGDKSFE